MGEANVTIEVQVGIASPAGIKAGDYRVSRVPCAGEYIYLGDGAAVQVETVMHELNPSSETVAIVRIR